MIAIFRDFCQFSAKKFAFTLKKLMLWYFFKVAVVWAKNANFVANFFGENIFKIIT
jgi:uncharacterized membrane protein